MLSETERVALRYIAEERSVLITKIPDKNERGHWGDVIPGIRAYKSLEKKGLVVITQEEPDETGFTWTPQIDITAEGAALAKTL